MANPAISTPAQDKPTVKALGAYTVGQVVHAVAAELEQGETKPPPRYDESTLIRDMENAHKFASTKEEQAMLRQTEGIGTARTREPMLRNLLSPKRQLLTSKKVGKRYELHSTQIAREMIGRIPKFLTNVATTAKWEMMLGAIERGEVKPEDVLASQVEYVKAVVERAKSQISPQAAAAAAPAKKP